MNLIVDQGNSICKFAVCSGVEIVEVGSASFLSQDLLVSVLSRYPEIDCAIYSTVGYIKDDTPKRLRTHIQRVVELSSETPVPIAVQYDRKKLGSDRLAAIVGAKILSPHKDVLVIDAGTAITYERISSDDIYLGGNISPGLHARLKAMHHFTNRLPLIDKVEQITTSWGQTTTSAMLGGVVYGLAYEVNGYIRDFLADSVQGHIYLTGGDAEFLQQKLEAKVDLVHDLVLIGLAHILVYNKR